MSEKPIIKKLNEIYRMGYVASRADEPYSFMVDNFHPAAQLCNCFGHACFNLKNEHYQQNNLTPNDTAIFGGCIDGLTLDNLDEYEKEYSHIHDVYNDTPEIVSKRLFDVVKSTGLIVEKCTEDTCLKSNQWKIALYFDYFKKIMYDYHFILQEKDGTWSSKMGLAYQLDKFDHPKDELYATYKLYGIYAITNPYAKMIKQEGIIK